MDMFYHITQTSTRFITVSLPILFVVAFAVLGLAFYDATVLYLFEDTYIGREIGLPTSGLFGNPALAFWLSAAALIVLTLISIEKE